jgi:hypothetical protein
MTYASSFRIRISLKGFFSPTGLKRTREQDAAGSRIHQRPYQPPYKGKQRPLSSV